MTRDWTKWASLVCSAAGLYLVGESIGEGIQFEFAAGFFAGSFATYLWANNSQLSGWLWPLK